MFSATRILATLSVVAVVIGLAQRSMADPIIITVSRMTDGTFTTASASTTLDSGDLSPSLQNNVTLSPALIPAYNSAFGTTLTNPFAGTGVNWTVLAQANVPGTPTSGLLQTSNIDANNPNATTYYMQVVINAGNYFLPSSPGAVVQAQSLYTDSSLLDSLAEVGSLIDSTLIGDMTFTGMQSTSSTIDYTRGPDYRLTNYFDITIYGGTPDVPSSVNVTVTTTVTPVSEPWTIATLMAMVIPGGLVCTYCRRRKLAACCS